MITTQMALSDLLRDYQPDIGTWDWETLRNVMGGPQDMRTATLLPDIQGQRHHPARDAG
jgi:hypothetical protein